MTKIKLSDLMDALDLTPTEAQSFIHLKTGEVHLITDEAIRIAEDNDNDFPDWQKDCIEIAKDFLKNENDYIPLPSQHEVNEYQMMDDFASSLEDEKMAGQLFISLRGKGAFRRFKDTVILLGIEKKWYEFRDEKYKEFAIAWCKDNNFILEK